MARAGRRRAVRPADRRPADRRPDDRRLAAVFGDVLPETTSDERGPRDDTDSWHLENRPPHHDR
nr:hypothetical protein [Amycolatopsis arida]